jgi:formate dehydrogenase subunit gamma
VFWSVSLLLISRDLVVWDQYFYNLTSIEQKRVAVLAQWLAAVVIICVWIVYLYAAAIWVSGTIPRHDARLRHRRLGMAPPPQMVA